MKLTNRLLIGAALVALPALAFALPVSLTAPDATFTAISGGTHHNGIGTDQIGWGVPVKGDTQSGLAFAVFSSPLNTETGDTFELGTLTHFNVATQDGTAANGATLEFSFDINGVDVPALDFMLGIDETPNKPPCQYTPVPADNYCPDVISFLNTIPSQTFSIGGVEYTLKILGFGNSATDILPNFISQEGGNNTIGLYAEITAATPVTVPEPNALILMLLGLLALGGALQLRRKQNEA
ncbi:MAG: THxN family PEP-CTERM protein [Rhodanobacteraceae bacterium]